MEWAWLKDWWRLKNLRKQHKRHKKKIASGATETSVTDKNQDADDAPALEKLRCRKRHRNLLLNSECDTKNLNFEENGQSVETPFKDNKVNKSIRKDSENDEYCNDDHVYAETDYNDDDDDDDDDCDDICYCDECFNGDTDLCESNDGMDSDASNSSNTGKQVVVGICAMAKKVQSKPMKEILTRLEEFEFIKIVPFPEEVILLEPVEKWPLCDCLISFFSKGFPLEKAISYAQSRKPYVLNNLHMQYDIQDRRRVYDILQKNGIEIPRYAVLDRDSPDPKQHELIESEDHVEINGVIFNKPFVEKPVSAEDHNIYIYYPTSAGGGSQRLFRKIGSRSSVYSPESRVRKTGSFIYEDFMPTDGTDVKVYTVGPDYAHAEARKSPALDGKVERDKAGKEIRYPVILNHAEKLISRKVCMAFQQTVCGFDLLRANGKSYVCDVNGFSFVKNSNKYYDDCAKILGNMILRELTPTLHIPWSVPFQLDDPPIVPTTFGKMMELRCVVAVIRHGDRTPKQKMKVEVRHPKFFEIFEKYDGYKHGHVKLKRPKQLQEILDIARYLLAEIETKADQSEVAEKKSKLEQLKNVLEMYGHFSGINRKVQMKYQPNGRSCGSSSDDDTPKQPSLVLILKWGGELTPAGRIQAEELGRIFRCMYPGGQGREDYSGTQGLGLLRLHSTFRHDLKIYASDEGRVQMTAAAFAKGLLALEGELTPILVQMVKSANTNGLLDNDCDSSKYQNIAKNRLHELMQIDRDFTLEDRKAINPENSISINQALDFVKNPVECCNHVHFLIKNLISIIAIKKDDPKTKDAILYHGETWDLMLRRWEKIEKDFSTKSKLFDISKIPDIYDCIKYDLQHNQHTLQYDQSEELYIYAKYLADIVIPQEYGLTIQEKLAIGQGICTPLMKKIQADLQRNIEGVENELVYRLNPEYSHGVASPERHVRTRLYFTSESHVHSLLTVLRFGGLLDCVKDEQWRRAMEYISMVSELNYMSQIVIMLYEDPTKDPTSEERFHVELHFSPGVNCCVQKNLPPGPGFRPHSRNDAGLAKTSDTEDNNNPSRIEEEIDDEHLIRSPNELSMDTTDMSNSLKSKPIPIGAHHTVSGHEAMDLAKRLNEELASQQQQMKQISSFDTPRPISPMGEPRSRSYEQRQSKEKDGNSTPVTSSASVSTRRQRHGIAGQMSYMKMLGFGGFSKKSGTSSSSLFSTAVISGSSSAPNLRVLIPCTVSSSVLDGFGGVPPIRPLETLHNALSLKKLDGFLHNMTSAPLFKSPAASPPKNPSTPVPSSEVVGVSPSVPKKMKNVQSTGAEANNEGRVSSCSKNIWSKQSSVASSTEPSSPAILSDTCSHETPSGEMSISVTSADGLEITIPATQEMSKFFPQLDDDLNSVTIYAPMNSDDMLDIDNENVFLTSGDSDRGDKSASLTPVSFGMDISMIANKGSMTLSIDGFDDDDEGTLSAATTPSLPVDDFRLETCHCCPTHAEAMQPSETENDLMFALPEPLKIPDTNIISSSPERKILPLERRHLLLADSCNCNIDPTKLFIRKTSEPVSTKMQKQLSLFEGGEFERQKDNLAHHASINIPAAMPQQLKHDTRLRKFENLTQSTSNSNFPFESNTLKRGTAHNPNEYVDVSSHTQSCINLKTSMSAHSSNAGSPQHKILNKPSIAQSCLAVAAENTHPDAYVAKEKCIEPAKRLSHGFQAKTQSMDADFLFNEFLLVPGHSPVQLPHAACESGAVSPCASPSSRPSKRFTATKVADDLAALKNK